jgi:hypothetical protein
MSNAIGRARVTAPGTIYTPDVMSDATIGLFRAMSSWTTTYPSPVDEPAPVPQPRRSVEQDTDRELIERAMDANPDAVRRMADLFRAGKAGKLTGEQVKDALEAFAREIGVFPEDARGTHGARTPGGDGLSTAEGTTDAVCPAWCTRDHTDDDPQHGTQHERILTELTAQDPAYLGDPVTALVYVERYDENGVTFTAEQVVVSLAEGPEAHYPGSEGVQGWTGSPEQADALAAALIEGARIARQARR